MHPNAGGGRGRAARLHRHGGLRAEHHLQAPDVAFGAVRHEHLARLAPKVAVEPVAQRLPHLRPPLLRPIPARTGRGARRSLVCSLDHPPGTDAHVDKRPASTVPVTILAAAALPP